MGKKDKKNENIPSWTDIDLLGHICQMSKYFSHWSNKSEFQLEDLVWEIAGRKSFLSLKNVRNVNKNGRIFSLDEKIGSSKCYW